MTAKQPCVYVLLPTYNEAKNVEPMTRALLDVFDENEINGFVLVIDDNSPDGTGEIADRLMAEDNRIGVVHRTGKQGLDRAYAAGFDRALSSGADLVVEMDCDFSHDHADVPKLIEAAEQADLVV